MKRGIGVDDVQTWYVQGGIGCIVLSTRGGWCTTACGHWITGDATEDRPKRICRKCRTQLPRLTPVSEAAGQGEGER